MRNYVIINGVNSLTIQGLAINNLPPITKPMIRTQREEIDGRDGDIVTELGYSAYDKQMEIGLYGNFDIDAIIKYFTGEGTIVFSNEADKYYNFKILDQIDYEKLLKFKTATIIMHCQPFKYPTEETPVEAKITTITGTGESITLENVEEAPMKIVYKGNTYQYSTSGKNLLRYTLAGLKTSNTTGTWNNNVYTLNGLTFTLNDDLTIKVNGTATGDSYTRFALYVNNLVLDTGSYYMSGCPSGGSASTYMIKLNVTGDNDTGSGKLITRTSTLTTGVFIHIETGTQLSNLTFKPMINTGTTAESYEMPIGITPNPDYPQPIQVVSGDNSIEVCGKNRLDMSSISVDTGCTINNGVITSNSLNAWNTFGIKINDIYLEPNVDYYVTFKARRIAGEGTFNYGGRITDGTNWSTQFAITKPTITNEFQTFCCKINTTLEKFVGIKMYFQNSEKVSTLEVKEIIVSKTQDDTYEPYTGASYPINLPVENLVDLKGIGTQTSNGITITDNDNGTYTLNGTATANIVFSKNISTTLPIGTYTYAMNNSAVVGTNASSSVYCYLLATETGTNWLFDRYSYQATNSSVTTTTTQSYSLNTFRIVIPNGAVLNNLTIGYQIEKGSKKNSFTPYGTTPIELCKIGTYQDKIDKSTGKNLFDKSSTPIYYGSSMQYEETSTGCKLKTSSLGSGFVLIDLGDIKNYENKTLTFSMSNTANSLYQYIAFIGCDNNGENRLTIGNALGSSSNTLTTTIGSGYTQTRLTIRLYIDGGTANTYYELNNIMVEINNQKTSYEPYGTSWYLKKEYAKYVFTGNETWSGSATNGFYTEIDTLLRTNDYNQKMLCNNFIIATNHTSQTFVNNTITGYGSGGYAGQNWVYLKVEGITSASDLKTWLSTHNVELQYALATPTYTLIEGELLNQLEAIKMSYEGQTNLSQTNNDLAFELDASVTFLTPMEINNIGNIYAKPILTIEGTGNIGVVLNGIQILEIDLSNNGKITIDVPKLEAYNPDDDSLLNRLVTGDYMKLLINEGDNKITFTGEVSGATLTNYTRWI